MPGRVAGDNTHREREIMYQHNTPPIDAVPVEGAPFERALGPEAHERAVPAGTEVEH